MKYINRILAFISAILSPFTSISKILVVIVGIVVFMIPMYVTNERAWKLEDTDPMKEPLQELATAYGIAGFLGWIALVLLVSFFSNWYKEYRKRGGLDHLK